MSFLFLLDFKMSRQGAFENPTTSQGVPAVFCLTFSDWVEICKRSKWAGALVEIINAELDRRERETILRRLHRVMPLIGDVVNIGSGEEVQIGTLTKKISQMFGGLPVFNLNKELVGSERLVCNNTKLKKMTGWKPIVPLDDGLQKTCDWFKSVFTEQ